MPISLYPDIDVLLTDLVQSLQPILDKNLIGLYLYGSLVTGDFDRDISDLDLLAVTAANVEREFEQLQAMHQAWVRDHPLWDNRLEIAYLSVAALRTFKTQASIIAIISPGEPFHLKEAGKDWLINWWIVRQQGVPLWGPPAATLIEPISQTEFLQAVQAQAVDWGEWIHHLPHRKYQAYGILTMCRALHACQTGRQVSKRQAAQWAQAELPQWAGLIQDALTWRAAAEPEAVDHAATFPTTVRFVNFVRERIAGLSPLDLPPT